VQSVPDRSVGTDLVAAKGSAHAYIWQVVSAVTWCTAHEYTVRSLKRISTLQSTKYKVEQVTYSRHRLGPSIEWAISMHRFGC
jgi:hypothetical protein